MLVRIISTRSDSVVILATALTYFVAGKLGLMLAIPPGYATAVWPAAGVALAAVLLKGNSACWGVFLGSFFVNLSMGFDGSSPDQLLKSLIVPSFIGLGAAIQAYVGGLLIRVFISPRPELDTFQSVFRFVLLGAGLSSMVNASIGTGTLLFAGIIAPDNYLINWATWWTGDAIGILIFTVLLLTLLSDDEGIWPTRRLSVTIPLIVSFIAIVVMFVLSSQWEVAQQSNHFQRKAEKLYQKLELAISSPQEVLRALVSFMQGSEEVTRDEFATFVQWPLQKHKSIQALAWVPLVDQSQREEMERTAIDDGLTAFTFTEIAGGQLRPAMEKERYFPVYYIEPMKGNEKALGLDLSSNQQRLQAIDLAIKTRGITSTESITLVQESGNQKAIIMFLAYYSKDDPNQLIGLLDLVFRIGDLVKAVITKDEVEGVVLSLAEYNEDGKPEKLLSTTEFWPESVAGKRVDQFSWDQELDVGNRKWGVSIVANQDLLAASRTLVPWAILASGLTFTGLLGVFILYVTGSAYRARTAAGELRDALGHLKQTQIQLVESEKLASLGGMMSGLAHELNTPIGIAITAASTIAGRFKDLGGAGQSTEADPKELSKFLLMVNEASKIIEGNLNRAAQLIKSYRDVSVDRATDEVRKIKLADYLEEILIYLRPTYKNTKHKIEIECPEEVSITTVPGGFSQIIINLINNSLIHGFDESVGGTILIKVDMAEDSVRLTYTDNGKGVPARDVQKVYEPFYTTRKGQGGTGLGLHLVRQIVEEKLQGTISLTSDVGQGVRFEIDLPLDLA